MNHESDEILMAQVADGKLDSLQVLFERHHLHVFNFLYKMSGDRMLSEDLTQEVFYKVIKYKSTYNNGKFVSWLFSIARNGLKTHFSRTKTMHSDIEEVAIKIEETNLESKEDFTHLQSALNQLDESDREILVLNRFHNIGYSELAEVLGSSEGAVKTKACRALKKLKTIYLESI